MHVLVFVEAAIYQMDEHNERLAARQELRPDAQLPGARLLSLAVA